MSASRYRITIDGPVPDRLFELIETHRVVTLDELTEFECEIRDPAELAGVLAKLGGLGVMASSVRQADQPSGRLRVDPVKTRVRAVTGAAVLIDSSEASLVHVAGESPGFAVPVPDVNWPQFSESDTTASHPILGDATFWHPSGQPGNDALVAWSRLEGLVQLDHDAAGMWFEEDAPIIYPPRDPFRRVDVHPSSRLVRYELDGQVIAKTNRPVLVTETGLPARWYVPFLDLNQALLTPSITSTGCQYKGEASYWSVEINGETHGDLVWTYPAPIAPLLSGMVCVLAERVDTFVNGVLEPRPVFSPAWLSPSLGLS